MTSAVPERPSRGAYAEAPEQGLGFYLGGQLSRGSSTRTLELGNQTYGLEGMAMLNFTDTTMSKNLSTSFYPDAGVVSSTLTYIPGLGDKGILVSMGGTAISTTAPARSNGTMVSRHDHWMSSILTHSRYHLTASTSLTSVRPTSAMQLVDGVPRILPERSRCRVSTLVHSRWRHRTTQVTIYTSTEVATQSWERYMTISTF